MHLTHLSVAESNCVVVVLAVLLVVMAVVMVVAAAVGLSLRMWLHVKQETRAHSLQNRALHNLSVSTVTTAIWNNTNLAI